MSWAERAVAWIVTQLARVYLRLHARSGYRYIAYYRVLLRTFGSLLLRRVLSATPLVLPAPKSGEAAIHMLTKSNEILFGLWSLRSLIESLGFALPVYIHDDGTLTASDRDAIERCLPGAHIVTREDADRKVIDRLVDLPHCRQFRESHILALKLFDPWVVQGSGDVILIDSDVLFFREPREILEWLDAPHSRQNRWNLMFDSDAPQARNEPDEALSPPVGFNSGIGLVTRASIDFERIESWLSHSRFENPNWLTEQTLYGLLAAESGMLGLPPTYHVANGTDVCPESLIAKHYVGTNRGFFIGEGIGYLLDRGHGFQRRSRVGE